MGCLGRAIDGAEKTLATVLNKARFWETHSGEQFNERQRKILNALLDGFKGKLTSSKWAVLGKCSLDTASRDIDDLVKHGILVKDAAGGRSTSYSLVEGSSVYINIYNNINCLIVNITLMCPKLCLKGMANHKRIEGSGSQSA